MTQLDSDLLRTFLAVAETGSVTAGAERIHRSQSATSLQIKQLEQIVGCALFRRHGRGVVTTTAGDRLLPVAQDVTRSLDSTLAEMRGESLSGCLRIGIPDDHSRLTLPRIIAEFGLRHPKVELHVQSSIGMGFDTALKSGELDIAIFEVPEQANQDEVLRKDVLVWLARRDMDVSSDHVLPVALFDRDCWWRDVALAGLNASGRRHRVLFTGESVVGIRSAVRSGIAAGLLSECEADDMLAPVPGLDIRTPSVLVMRRAQGAAGDTVEALSEVVRLAFSP